MVNLVDIHIQPPFLWSAAIIWPPICIAIVAARFFTRKAQKSRIGLDDWLTLPALLLVLGIGANLLVGVNTHALGYPTPKAAPDQALTASSREQTIARKVYWISMILDLPALTIIKISCMLFYARIFGRGSSRIVSFLIHVMNVLISIWGLGFWLSFLFACGKHWSYLWTNLVDMAKCPLDLIMMHESLFISNVIMDLMIFIFPIPLVLKLQISNSKKFAVLIVFLLGAMTIAMSVIRLTFTIEQAKGQYSITADENFISTAGLYFMHIEVCFALCTICLPTLAGAFKLKGVQSVVQGFSSILSNMSRASFIKSSKSSKSSNSNSRRSSSTKKDPEKLESAGSSRRALSGSSEAMFEPRWHAEANTDVELGVQGKGGIFVTSTVDQYSLDK